ncbi:MAG: hypothetical protein LBK60_10780 [Verrucomicrobiales bacterium]|jgi:hypothetical protein|nr:hypothetical protein [Verrucomicrobiales bacterium]
MTAGWGIILYALACFASRFKYWTSYWHDGVIYFSDPDCYTRLYRVKRLLAEGRLFQAWHPFENFPAGCQVHTTAPLDWLLAALTVLLRPFTNSALDWAGALGGPLLAALTGGGLYYLARDFKPRWAKWPLLLTYLFSPMLIWSTSVARPDHQNLIVSLLILAFALEFSRWEQPRRHWCAGVVWGLALWVSFLEPLCFLAVIVGVNLLWRRREDWRCYATILVIVSAATLLEGFRWEAYRQLAAPLTANWLATIGELRSILNVDFTGQRSVVKMGIDLVFRYGLAIYLLPFILLMTRRRRWWRDPALMAGLLATVLALALYLTQQRWGYCFAAAGMFALFACLPDTLKLRWKILILSLHFFPMLCLHVEELQKLAEHQTPPLTVTLREAALHIKHAGTDGAILAPWWLSPALLYYSDRPIVASSSHESIAGITDSARFYTARDFHAAYDLLNRRQVAWVIAYRPELLYRNSMQILTGAPVQSIPFADADRSRVILRRLFENHAVPRQFTPAYLSPDFILYRYRPRHPELH